MNPSFPDRAFAILPSKVAGIGKAQAGHLKKASVANTFQLIAKYLSFTPDAKDGKVRRLCREQVAAFQSISMVAGNVDTSFVHITFFMNPMPSNAISEIGCAFWGAGSVASGLNGSTVAPSKNGIQQAAKTNQICQN